MIAHLFNHRQFCQLSAVYTGVKPTAIIESIDILYWDHISSFLEDLDLSYCYRSSIGYVLWKGDGYFLLRDGLERIERRPRPVVNWNIEASDILVSREYELLIELVNLWSKETKGVDDHRRLGELLGYPRCCVEKFIERGVAGARRSFHRQLIGKGLDMRVPIEFWAIYHTPCSIDCGSSMDLGRRYIESVRRISMDDYRWVVSRLESTYLAYSVGSRYVSFKAVLSSFVDERLKKRIRQLFRDLKGYRLVFGLFNRPYIYAVYRDYSIMIFDRMLTGLKAILYSPGRGVIVYDPFADRIVLKVDKRITSRYGGDDTVFRLYSSEKHANSYMFNTDLCS